MIDPDITITVEIVPSLLDPGYVCQVLEFPGCLASGLTRQEAVASIAEAIGAFEALEEVVDPI